MERLTCLRRRRLGRDAGESGQAFIETVLMIWLLTLLLSAIIQVFLVHNYVYQMANNAYYSLFKDKAYGRWNKPDKEFQGYPNYVQKKPLRAVKALEQAGGKVHVLASQAVNWSDDDRAAVPMMPFFEEPIVVQLRNYGITREGVRLKVGTAVQGQNYLDTKFLRMAMGTEGGFSAFANMIGALAGMANKLGQNYTQYTDGYSGDDLDGLAGDYDDANDDLNEQDPDGAEKGKDLWDVNHGDFNHDGYNDFCETVNGNNHPDCKNNRPWE